MHLVGWSKSVAGVNASAFVERQLIDRVLIFFNRVAGVNASAFVERNRAVQDIQAVQGRVAGVNASAFVERSKRPSTFCRSKTV